MRVLLSIDNTTSSQKMSFDNIFRVDNISRMPPDFVSVSQAAEMLGVSRQRVLAIIASGLLPAQRLGHAWMIKRRDVAKMPRRNRGRPKGKTK